ncbi:hypothetical protein RR46_14215 [Papilio xuthus]|uniref:Uncharacterized protein n=1 Tax=Papilio xuthus TaxID=66420 RepID=A0A194PJT9_PAPXU|nr:hypothetical protein RR46_14215 [Papilio xuthus]
MLFRKESKEIPTQTAEITKWWDLKGDKIPKFCEQLEDLKVDTQLDIDTIWGTLSKSILKAANNVFGRTKRERRYNKETWWWSEEVKNFTRSEHGSPPNYKKITKNTGE